MTPIPAWRRYLHFWRRNVARDVDDELRFHFESRIGELIAGGASPSEARAAAVREFGDVEATRAGLVSIGRRLDTRRGRALWWESVRQDLRYGLRGLRRTPLFTGTVVVTVALGIGAAASMYGVMRRLLLEPPPHVVAPERVVHLFNAFPRPGQPDRTFNAHAYPLLDRLRTESRTLAGLGAYFSMPAAIGSGANAAQVKATFVSSGFWVVLGVRPALGRFFADAEAHPATGARVAVLGHAFWRRRFDGDRLVIGRTLRIKGQPYEIIGVAPRGFRATDLADVDLWLPLRAYDDDAARAPTWHTLGTSNMLGLVGRLATGATDAQANAELTTLVNRFMVDVYRTEFQGRVPAPKGMRLVVAPVIGGLGSDMQRIPEAKVSVWLVGIAIVLLVIACANVAGLLLLRAMRRRREIAVRIALGMTRARLAALLFTESALLAVTGGLLALAVVVWGGALIDRVLLPDLTWESARAVDPAVAALTSLCIIGTALIAGLAPVLYTRRDLTAELKDSTRSATARRSIGHSTLLGAQAALSVVLLVGAGLFLRSLHNLRSVDLGLDTEHSLAISVDFAGTGRAAPQIAHWYDRALERTRALRGIDHAGLAYAIPLRLARGGGSIRLPGRDTVIKLPGQGVPSVNYVSAGFFAATGMRLLGGRDFLDAEHDAPVIIVNESMAKLYWPGRSALGECVYVQRQTTCTTVIGVVKDARMFRISEPPSLFYYRPLPTTWTDDRVLLAHARPGTRGMERAVRAALQELEPGLPFIEVQTLQTALNPQIRPWRLGATVFTAFGILAVVLAAIGLSAAVAYAVTQRTREIGVRIAIGARHRDVMRLVLRDGIRIGLAGIVAGAFAGLVAGHWVRDLLFEVSPRDVGVFALVGLFVLVIAVLASLAPSWRAARIDPMVALRSE